MLLGQQNVAVFEGGRPPPTQPIRNRHRIRTCVHQPVSGSVGLPGSLRSSTGGPNTSPWVTLGVYHPESAAAPRSVPAPGTIVGLWQVRTLAQARTLQDGADAGHQAWLLSPELVSISYGATELDLFEPVARQVGPAAYKVGPRNSEWVATLYLAQPVRQGPGGIWVVTRTGSPAS